MCENKYEIKNQSTFENDDYEDENYFDTLTKMLSELNMVIIQFLDINQEDFQDRDGFFKYLFFIN